jgi:hypothetical protein
MSANKRKSRPIAFVAMFLAWLVPGAGHAYIGRPLRGLILFVTIGATFWTGVAMGGVMTVDSRTERWWFAAQMLAGMHGLVGWHRQQQVYTELMSEHGLTVPATTLEGDLRIDQTLARERLALVSPLDTVARAYAGVAGLLNLLCMFDAVMLALMGVANKPPDEQGQAA